MVLFSCSSDNGLVEENEQLRERIKQDSIWSANYTQESVVIDSLLGQISGFTSDVQGGLLEDVDIIAKAEGVATLVEAANEKIARLEKEIVSAKGKASKSRLLSKLLKQQKAKVAEQEVIIQELQDQIANLENENSSLKDDKKQLSKKLQSSEQVIATKDAELGMTKEQINALMNQLEQEKIKAARELKIAQMNNHLGIGVNLVTVAKSLKGGLGGNAKKEKRKMLLKAFEQFTKAYDLGRTQTDKMAVVTDARCLCDKKLKKLYWEKAPSNVLKAKLDVECRGVR